MRSLQSIFAVLALAAVLVAATGCDNYRTARHRLVGWQAYNDADYAAAYDRFAQAVDLDSTDWVSQYYLGVLELDWRKNPAEARRRLEIAETLRDAHPNAQYGGEVGQEHGVVDRPTRAMVTEKLAQALLAQGYNRQLASYLRETADNFGETDDYLRLARYLHKVGDPDGYEPWTSANDRCTVATIEPGKHKTEFPRLRVWAETPDGEQYIYRGTITCYCPQYPEEEPEDPWIYVTVGKEDKYVVDQWGLPANTPVPGDS